VSGFQHDIAGGQGNLIITSVQSPNFVHNSTGWQIKKDGSAEFNNLTIRGTFNGTNFVLNSSGFFLYSGPPASGNLIESFTNGTGTDGQGNAYLQGTTSYLNAAGIFTASNLNGGILSYWESATAAGPYTQFADIGFAWNNVTGGSLLLQAGNQVKLGQAGNALWDEVNQRLQLPVAGLVAAPSGTPETWHAMGAFNANFSHGSPAPAYRFYPDNTVAFTGQVNVAAGTTSGTVFTLPTSTYFPLSVKTFPVPIGAGTPATSGSARVNIGTIGNIVLAGGPTVAAYTFSLDGIRYPLDI